jgi:dimethylaniline monooxygenase (N-oxide forming)
LSFFVERRANLEQLQRTEPPLDRKITRRFFFVAGRINNLLPTWLSNAIASYALDRQMRKDFNLKDEWRLLPAPPIANSPGTANDYIIDELASGRVTSLGGPLRFTSTGIVTGIEGEVACDVVILATGSQFDYSFLAPEADPTAFPTPEWDAHPNSQGLRFPRLYRTIFHPEHVDSLAFFGPCRGFTFAAFNNADLVAQAIGQIWSGGYPLPAQAEVDRWCADNYRFSLTQIEAHRLAKTGTEAGDLEHWLSEVAGTGMNEKLGWGLEGWKFWWNERKLYNLIMGGLFVPYAYRLFDGRPGGRKRWEGAKEAIFKVNGLTPP